MLPFTQVFEHNSGDIQSGTHILETFALRKSRIKSEIFQNFNHESVRLRNLRGIRLLKCSFPIPSVSLPKRILNFLQVSPFRPARYQLSISLLTTIMFLLSVDLHNSTILCFFLVKHGESSIYTTTASSKALESPRCVPWVDKVSARTI